MNESDLRRMALRGRERALQQSCALFVSPVFLVVQSILRAAAVLQHSIIMTVAQSAFYKSLSLYGVSAALRRHDRRTVCTQTSMWSFHEISAALLLHVRCAI